MTIRAFRLKGDPILKLVAEEISPTDDQLPQIVQDLQDTAAAGDPSRGLRALGLAAPQIGYSRRVIIVYKEVYVNPVIIPISYGEESVQEEMCFSEPGIRLRMRRCKRIRVEYYEPGSMDLKRIKADGTLSHIFQHEVDHLNGILMSERAFGFGVGEQP